MDYNNITESNSAHDNLEKMSTSEILKKINYEDNKVSSAVKKVIPKIKATVEKVVKKIKNGGRLFYIGAGTSGRLGILDASECPPTFGTDPDTVIGIIAGGDLAIKKSIENAEDKLNQGWIDLKKYQISNKDIVIGIAASGTTPYVVNALKKCKINKIYTVSITSNPSSAITKISDLSIEIILGPEFITGSSRMKSGTAQKMILNMISSASMIKLGHIMGNKMIDIQLTNNKLKKRAVNILKDTLKIDNITAKKLLKENKSVRLSIKNWKSNEQS
jgi:N-acetylmuramic acid 6-phosphate etherase